MTVARIRAACKGISKHENKTPESDDDDQNIVELSEDLVMIEDTAVEEEDTKLDKAVCKLLNYENRIINLGNIWISYSFPEPSRQGLGLVVLTTYFAFVCNAPVNCQIIISAKLTYGGRC